MPRYTTVMRLIIVPCMLLALVFPVHCKVSTTSEEADTSMNSVESLSRLRSLLGKMMDTVQVHIESGMKAAGLASKTKEGTPTSDLVQSILMQEAKTQVDHSQGSRENASNILNFSGIDKTISNPAPFQRKLDTEDDRETAPKDILGEEEIIATGGSSSNGLGISALSIRPTPNGCRCEYPGEHFYPILPPSLPGKSKGKDKEYKARRDLGMMDAKDDKSETPAVTAANIEGEAVLGAAGGKSKGNKSKNGGSLPDYGFDDDGVLVLPITHPSCRNIIYICPDETPPDVPEWTCPDPIMPPGGGGKSKGKGKGNKASSEGKRCSGKGKGNKSGSIGCGDDGGIILPGPTYVILPEDNPLCLPCRCQYPGEDFYDDFIDPCDLPPTSFPAPAPAPTPSKGKSKGNKSKSGKCSGKITALDLIWDGPQAEVRVTGQQTSSSNGVVSKGESIKLLNLNGDNDQTITVSDLSGNVIGTSTFHISCSDDDMNSIDDCGKRQGNGKKNDSGLNEWILDGLESGGGTSFQCGVGLPVDGSLRALNTIETLGGKSKGKDNKSKSKGGSISGSRRPDYLIKQYVIVDGELVLPPFHPSCKCAEFTCEEIDEGDEWTCPAREDRFFPLIPGGGRRLTASWRRCSWKVERQRQRKQE